MFKKWEKRFVDIDFVNQPGVDDPILFYPKEFYVFDNFSSFQITWNGKIYPTSEHVYQSIGFNKTNPKLAEQIRKSCSAHDAQCLAYDNRQFRDSNRKSKKKDIMKSTLYAKIEQHPYVKKKLLQSGNRMIIEDSRRDDKRGRGLNKDGENMLGEIRMEIRNEINKD